MITITRKNFLFFFGVRRFMWLRKNICGIYESGSRAGGTVVMNTHGSTVVTKQGNGIISGKGSSLIVQKK